MGDEGAQAAASGASEVWQVADLTIDVGRQRVLRGVDEIALPKLSFDLLLTLARRAPNVLSSDELISRVWPGLVVAPETVVQRVKLLRQALDDRSEDPRYVAALRGRGYRLVPTARRVEPTPEPTEPRSIEARDESLPAPANPMAALADRKGSSRVAVAALLAAAVVVAAWLHLRGDVAETPATSQPAELEVSAAERQRTVAVLPFENLSPSADDAFIAISLPEMTLNRLASVRGLTVIARESSFRAGRSDADVQEIGTRLGAGYLVGGSVQRRGDDLRVTARLVDASTGTQLWSERFDGTVADLFRVQDEIADRVAAVLESRVAGLELPRRGRPTTGNVEAYLAFLRGRSLIGRFTVAEADAAATEFERAIGLDPSFAAAHAALYDARMQAVGLRHDDLEAARTRHRPLIEKALAIDPSSGAAWYARAMWEDLDLDDREAAFRKAVALDPGNTRGLVAFSEFLDITDTQSDGARVVGSGFDPSSRMARKGGDAPQTAVGARAAEAERILGEALRIDPLSPRAHFRVAMRSFRRGGGNVEAPVMAILELDPDYYPALQRVAKYRSLFHGRPSEAIALIEQAIRLDPQNPWAPHTAVAFYLDAGDPAAAADVAASTAVSAQSARPLLAQYAGDWRGAGESAMSVRGFEFGFNESWGVAEALRDYALRSGDFTRPVSLLRERFNLPDDSPPELTLGNYRAAVPLAHLELARGNEARARDLLQAVLRHLDADVHSPPVYKRRSRSQALMLLGDPDAALAELEASFRDDRDFTQWWYAIDRDPVWEPFRGSDRFQTLAREVRAYASSERARVDELRREGKVPARPSMTGRHLTSTDRRE